MYFLKKLFEKRFEESYARTPESTEKTSTSKSEKANDENPKKGDSKK